jgi:putative ABC transport system substrate-binding protein
MTAASALHAQQKAMLVTGFLAASALAAKGATVTIPIVFSAAAPVGAGLVDGLARPGGNLTGFSMLSTELTPKRLDLLSELVPQAGVIALLVNPNNAVSEPLIRVVQEAGYAKGVQLQILNATSESEIETPFAMLVQMHAGALLVGTDPFFFGRREQLAALAAYHAVPAIYFEREFAAGAGGLICYGMSFTTNYRLVADYAGRIRNGAKPADRPVEQPTTFELVVNLNTAEALGLTVYPSILAPTRSSNEAPRPDHAAGRARCSTPLSRAPKSPGGSTASASWLYPTRGGDWPAFFRRAGSVGVCRRPEFTDRGSFLDAE